MLNRKICKRCVNESSQFPYKWCKEDDKNWDKGTFGCYDETGALVIVDPDDPPSKDCRYLAEQTFHHNVITATLPLPLTKSKRKELKMSKETNYFNHMWQQNINTLKYMTGRLLEQMIRAIPNIPKSAFPEPTYFCFSCAMNHNELNFVHNPKKRCIECHKKDWRMTRSSNLQDTLNFVHKYLKKQGWKISKPKRKSADFYFACTVKPPKYCSYASGHDDVGATPEKAQVKTYTVILNLLSDKPE